MPDSLSPTPPDSPSVAKADALLAVSEVRSWLDTAVGHSTEAAAIQSIAMAQSRLRNLEAILKVRF